MADDAPDPLSIALRLLARREYSRRELQGKLLRSGCEPQSVLELLDKLADSGYQDDQRYAEMLTRTRLRQGHGPLRLRQDLQKAGVEVASARTEMLAAVDWFTQAQAVYRKRFGDTVPEDARDYARCARFLAGRGFLPEQIRRVLAHAAQNPDDFTE